MLARRRPERGAAAVEFALVLPVLMLIIGAIIDFGFVFAQQIAFNTSARDAARAGCSPPWPARKLTCGQVAHKAARSDVVRCGRGQQHGLSIGVAVTGAGGSCSLPAGSELARAAPAPAFPCTGSGGRQRRP